MTKQTLTIKVKRQKVIVLTEAKKYKYDCLKELVFEDAFASKTLELPKSGYRLHRQILAAFREFEEVLSALGLRA